MPQKGRIEDPYGYKSTIATAASRARGDRLEKLYHLCEQQKTVSTRKLVDAVDDMAEGDQLDAIHFRALAERLKELEGLRRDAERYRFMRNEDNWGEDSGWDSWENLGEASCDRLDRIVDSRMKSTNDDK